MGFLDHSTNNIILDAVLTDTGRKFLSRNDGSFSITKFALGDDEVDYGVIQKYGRTVGKEKVEKNTPVFEALTNGNQALKYRLVSLSNPNLIRLPGLGLSGEGVSGNVVTMGRNTNTSRSITVSQTIENEVLRLISHGLLHIFGMKDNTKPLRNAMANEEDKFIAKFHVKHTTSEKTL